MKYSNIKIINKTGLVPDTKTYVGEAELTMVRKIELTLEAGDIIYATITVLAPQLELVVPEAAIETVDGDG